ncbi:MAG: hypothetical protein Q8R92_19800 [Deltaproteobacteria bacterium]|nr:hypothetical protein [Deltaproteobacteria bacterium]
MATAVATVSRDIGERDGSTIKYSWPLTSTNVDGQPVEWTEWADRTWTVTGTWGGATCSFEGSNDGSVYVTLSNAAGGTAATKTADGALAIIETPRYVRPKLTTAGTDAVLTVIMIARRHTGMRT